MKSTARTHGVRTLVETGTYRGDTVAALAEDMERIISIELSGELAARARDRFASEPTVTIIHGDSGRILPTLVPDLDEPALFWLDGHWSGGTTARGPKDTPIIEELQAILAARIPHVVLIDDARCFGRDPGYPSVDELRNLVSSIAPGHAVDVADDIIRIVPISE